ncbi:flagellar basal-body rod protein FlgF [Propylenella binzhouense]|uniref:Flagellar basal-body rod protein FlgF n=1 Tax=Propylenella binzhouense TaxID=2555902 RepID=A0A964T1Z7_9HYPH|nr:flagellar basal-body rod protein FlgF [Propylenella binzhouense]
MESSLYVSLSGQIALERRLETIARNMANVSTAGYRADEVSFEAILSRTGDPVAFASTGETFIERRSGAMTQTGNPLDVAVRGEGWFAIQTPAGIAYTRDGRMRMLPTGELQTLAGHPVLDVGNAPIQLDPDGGAISIASDGMITQAGEQRGAIGLFSIDPAAGLKRYDSSAVIPDRPAAPVLDFAENGVAQGFVEGSNVDPVRELTKLIIMSRAFEATASAVAETEGALKDTVKTLGTSV